MTRFARAKGSKSSNERLPEEATSWQEMKRQLQEKQNSAKNTDSVKFERSQFNFKVEKTSEWAEFEKPTDSNKIKKKKNKHISLEHDDDNTKDKDNLHKLSQHSNKVKKKSNKHINKVKKVFDEMPMPEIEINTTSGNIGSTEKKKKKKKDKNKDPFDNIETKVINYSEEESRISNAGFENDLKQKKVKNKKKKINSQPDEERNSDLNLTENITSDTNIENGKQKKIRKKKIKYQVDEDGKKPDLNYSGNTASESNIENIKQERVRKRKIKDKQLNHKRVRNSDTSKDSNKQNMKNNKLTRKQKGLPYKKRKADVSVDRMFINGKEIFVTKFDGFPVKKEDGDRLAELQKNMLSNGISREEISATMKSERRKAEKALARERKKVCFHCRKSNHKISECPELGDSNETGTGICFKCGSTEHTHFQCKVVRTQDFRYASCFICKEQGHIARQCPDNPRGLYPKGGGCKICGDVTHLKKDCPDLIAKKENDTVTLQTLDSNSLEVLDEDIHKNKHKSFEKKSTKKSVIKF